MRLHRYTSGFIVLALLLSLAMACGGGDGGGDASEDGETANTQSGNGASDASGSTAAVAEAGSPAPDFAVTAFENANYTKDQVINLSDLRGKPVVITFWYPACTPCADLIILLKDAYDNTHAGNVHFIAIQESLGGQSDWDPPSNPEAGQKFTTDKELQFIVAFDPDSDPDAEDKRGSIAKAYNVQAWPTTYFLNKDLTICATQTYLRERTIEDNIEAVSGTDCPEPR